MADRHAALIVEDEPDMAAELADLLRSLRHDHIHAETLADARARLDEGGFCYVLLDLQIKADGQSIKPRVESGMTLLREIRQRFPRRSADGMHLMPVLVISGHKDSNNIIGAYDGGIDAFITKPLSLGAQDIGARIRRCLEFAGRDDHRECAGCSDAAVARRTGMPRNGTAFWHAPDYSEIRLHGEPFYFTGDVNRAVVRLLHEAAVAGQPWQSGKATLAKAGSQDAEGKMANLFGDHPCWGKLLLSNRRGKYRLIIE